MWLVFGDVLKYQYKNDEANNKKIRKQTISYHALDEFLN